VERETSSIELESIKQRYPRRGRKRVVARWSSIRNLRVPDTTETAGRIPFNSAQDFSVLVFSFASTISGAPGRKPARSTSGNMVLPPASVFRAGS
jgi:hypothetical protein